MNEWPRPWRVKTHPFPYKHAPPSSFTPPHPGRTLTFCLLLHYSLGPNFLPLLPNFLQLEVDMDKFFDMAPFFFLSTILTALFFFLWVPSSGLCPSSSHAKVALLGTHKSLFSPNNPFTYPFFVPSIF